MGEFVKAKRDRHSVNSSGGSGRMSLSILLLSWILFLSWPFGGYEFAQAQEQKTVAVLPFRIHSLQPMEQVKPQLQEMLSSRMAKEGLKVVSPAEVNSHPMARLPISDAKDAAAVGKDLRADYVLIGSLTHVGRKISLDVKAVDVHSQRPPLSLFVVEDDLERLAEAVDRATLSLANQIGGFVQVDSVLVRGNKRIEAEAILAVLETKKGDRFDRAKLDKDLRSVFAMGFFKDVDMEAEDGPKGKTVIVNVNEKPSISRITFEGNKKISEEDLKKEVGIKLFAILNESEVKQSVNRLREFYRQKAYYNVEIKSDIRELPQNEVALVYSVDEGKRLYITKIEFTGNHRFSDKQLKNLMEVSEKGFFSWFTNSGLLDKSKLDFDLQKIAAYYHNHGFIKAKTGEPKVTVGETGLTITTEIVEGDQYAVDKVQITGDLIRPEPELLKKVKINKEKYFNREVIRKDMLDLRDLYADEGYAYAEVVPGIQEDDDKKLVNITYQLSKNNKVRFERINIAGNTLTRDKVIRRELKIVEGEEFSGKNVKRSTQNLNRLGFFEDVDIQTKKGSQDDLMVVDVGVKEKPTGSFSIGAGYSSFDNAIGMFSVAQNNLAGRGQRLAAMAQLGSRTTEIDLRFTEPWLMDKPVAMDVDLYKLDREYYEYTRDSYGGGLRFAFPIGLDEFTKGITGYNYDDSNVTDVDPDASTIIQDMKGHNITSSMTFGIRRNSKDRPWDTREGSLNSLTYEYAGDGLGGNVGFDKFLATSAWYFPLPKNTAFMAQGRWGYVVKRADEDLPVYQKFRIGGINTVRGYQDYSISPIDPATEDRIGGEKMLIFNFEYRVPLLKEQGISGVLFFDAGNSWAKEDEYSVTDLKKSAGIGMRWYSPVGPLRIEYGWPINPKPEDEVAHFAFSVGGLF
jgi:outer membrane protein insertion porin family